MAFFSSVVTRYFDRLGSSVVAPQLCAGHKLKPLDRLGTNLPKMLFQLLKLIVGNIDQRRLDFFSLFGEERDDGGEIDLGFSFADTRDHFATVQFKIRAQHFDGKFTELRSRAARTTTAGISGFERARVGLPERCHGLLSVVRFEPI